MRSTIFSSLAWKYTNKASLVYSIRPPTDMQGSIATVAKEVGADLLIRPFSSERTDLRKYFRNFKCINHNSAVFFLYTQ